MFYGLSTLISDIHTYYECIFDFDFEMRTNEENHLDKMQFYTKKLHNTLFDILTKTESEIKFINDFTIWNESHKPENLPSTQNSHNCFRYLVWASNRINFLKKPLYKRLLLVNKEFITYWGEIFVDVVIFQIQTTLESRRISVK